MSAGFLLMAAALFYLDTENLLPLAALACALHELGHCVAVTLLGGHILVFRLTAVGGELVLDQRQPLSYGRELTAVLAGPGVNLAAAVLAARLGKGEAALVFAGLNLALGLFNLLPVRPLDGGRCLGLLLGLLRAGSGWAGAAEVCSALGAGLLLLVGGALFWRTGDNFTLLALGLWLTLGAVRGVKRENNKK